MKSRLHLTVLLVCAIPAWGIAGDTGTDSGDEGIVGDGPCFALLVGVTRYQTFPSLDLEGPANDVVLMRKLLTERYGFPDANVVILSGAEGATVPSRLPTRANIEREMTELAKKVDGKKGARVVVHLSGHGTRQPDLLRPDPKPDGMSEVFLPADFSGWDKEAKRLRNSVVDFELRDWLKAVQEKGASVWVVVDSCYSGTIARGLAVPRKVDNPDVTLAIPRAAYQQAEQRVGGAKGGGPSGLLPIDKPGLVAIYAALPSEPTYEDRLPFDAPEEQTKKYGLLTWFLCEALNDQKTKGVVDVTYTELVLRIQAKYRRNGLSYPTPLVEGADRDRLVLGTKPRRTTIFLTKLKNGRLQINAGRLHGLLENTVLAIFPPAGQGAADKPLGHVRIAKAGTVQSTVEPWDEKDALEEQKNQFFRPWRSRRTAGGASRSSSPWGSSGSRSASRMSSSNPTRTAVRSR